MNLFKALVMLSVVMSSVGEMIQWPIFPLQNSTYGFVKRFQISSLRPVPNDTFTTQVTISLIKDIFWEGLKDTNLYYMYDKNHNYLRIKDKRQFATDAGYYKAGDNIILGFNMTIQSGVFYQLGGYYFSVGEQQAKEQHNLQFQFNMTHSFHQTSSHLQYAQQ